MAHILLADDDIELSGMLVDYLAVEGFDVDVAHDGDMTLSKIAANQYDLLILDVMMPRRNGFDVLRELRTRSQLPVLMLTARGHDVDSIVGLELGADDYLAKPSNPRVLLARIRAILRRAEAQGEFQNGKDRPDQIVLDDIVMHNGSRTVTCGNHSIAMTSTEFSLLHVLLREAGQVVLKATLSQQALGRKLSRYDRSLDMHVSNLRKKLRPLPDGQERIKTVRGVGYIYSRN
ncbi:winged helix family two component transcriptional regulator [Nitrosospira sp. Nsp2]|uniref:response regulator n=1 Tax=Nitrosospira sp. Nsp2 TaxID=136548 RepID=UPI000D311792|nr:response regulator [Nitrosospira sp. Nsp2]PTR16025.1 winged helix family two component transcriptional regulator [Nitrosospira sp. Nsp2]